MTENDKIIKGLVAWNKNDFKEINEQLSRLLLLPKDDWNLNLRNIGNLPKYHPMNGIFVYMRGKYSGNLFKNHFLRYNNIIKFLKKFEKDLSSEGFLKKQGNQHFLKDELIESLCELPFNEMIVTEKDNIEYFFSYDEVIARVKELLKNNS